MKSFLKEHFYFQALCLFFLFFRLGLLNLLQIYCENKGAWELLDFDNDIFQRIDNIYYTFERFANRMQVPTLLSNQEVKPDLL